MAALLRNALVAAELNELDDPVFELNALKALIGALFAIRSIDEVEPLVLRYREAAKAQSGKGFCLEEFDSLLCSARLHEVLCMHPSFGNPLPQPNHCYQHGHVASYCHRFRRAREKTNAPAEPCALCRHAGSLKRP